MSSPSQPYLNWEFRTVASNPEGTCLGQSMKWLSDRKNGVTQKELGLWELSANSAYSRNLQGTPAYWQSLSNDASAQRFRHGETAHEFLSRVIWNTYNIIHITPVSAQGHAIALYYPYTSQIQLFDPNQGVYKTWFKNEIIDVLARFATPTVSGNWEFESVINFGSYLT